MQIHQIKTSEIKAYSGNPRKNDIAVEAVAASIKQFGFKVPLVITADYEIVCGHTRLKAAIVLEHDTVPCIIADDLTPKQIKAFRLADNKVAELAEWDMELLETELKDIDLDMSAFGFDSIALETTTEASEDNFNPDPPLEAKTKLGDIFQLGTHRLMCGDATNPKHIAALMSGDTADLLLTDPPYGVNYEDKQQMLERMRRSSGSSRVREGNLVEIKGDIQSAADLTEFLDKSFAAAATALKNGGAVYIFHASGKSIPFMTALEKNFVYYQHLQWIKNHHTFGMLDYQMKHEPILYGYKGGDKKYFIDNRTQTSVYEDAGLDYKKMTKTEAISMLKNILESHNDTSDVLYENKPEKSDLHPTMKPIKLLARLIRNSTKQDQIVLDPFGGSGSTLIACEQLGRQARLLELEPKYCDVIIARYEQFTGKKAVKL